MLQSSHIPSCLEVDSANEILRFYIDKNWHGKGLAQSLMTACFQQLKIREVNNVWLGVWENNARAISFYEKSNFKETGEHVFSLGTDEQ